VKVRVEVVKKELKKLETGLGATSDTKEPPYTTLQILNRGHRERAWHKTLEYFIDPDKPHGFGTEVLDRFLSTIQEHEETDFRYSEFNLENVRIESEVDTPHGRIDLVVTSGQEWFLCVELKVESKEGTQQTERYVETENIGDVTKEEFSDGSYIYISKESGDSPSADEFADVSWKAIVKGFENILSESRGRYPARSLAQLSDFVDTVKEETGMTEDTYEQEQRKKAKLYAEHQEAIEEARDAFNHIVEREQNRWSERFVSEFELPSWDDEWNCDTGEKGQIYMDNWRLNSNMNPTAVTSADNRVQLHFVHLIRDEDALRDGRLIFETKWPSGDEIRDRFDEWFTKKGEERVKSAAHGIETSAGQIVYTRKIYEFDVSNFPESYYETLVEAFEEHQEVADILSEGLEKVLERATE
jgi:hypothetical protein